MLFKLCFRDVQIFSMLYSPFLILAPQNPPKNYHTSLKKMLHQENLFYCLKYLIRFLIKLWIKFFLLHFHFFKVFNHFLRVLCPKSHPKNQHSSSKKSWHQKNLLSLFETYVKVFDKIVIQDFFVSFVNIF